MLRRLYYHLLSDSVRYCSKRARDYDTKFLVMGNRDHGTVKEISLRKETLLNTRSQPGDTIPREALGLGFVSYDVFQPVLHVP